jgi:hypothetical protein
VGVVRKGRIDIIAAIALLSIAISIMLIFIGGRTRTGLSCFTPLSSTAEFLLCTTIFNRERS